MNKKKAISILQKSNSIRLYQSAAEHETWISNGHAIYNMGNFPWCEENSQVAAVLGLTEKQESSCNIAIEQQFPLEVKDGISAELSKLCIVLGGVTLAVFYDEEGMIHTVNTALLKPFDNECNYRFIRESKLIEVRYGLIEVGYLALRYIDKLTPEIERLYKSLKKMEVEDETC